MASGRLLTIDDFVDFERRDTIASRGLPHGIRVDLTLVVRPLENSIVYEMSVGRYMDVIVQKTSDLETAIDYYNNADLIHNGKYWEK